MLLYNLIIINIINNNNKKQNNSGGVLLSGLSDFVFFGKKKHKKSFSLLVWFDFCLLLNREKERNRKKIALSFLMLIDL